MKKKDVQEQKVQETNDKIIVEQESVVNQATSLSSYMLPPEFRKRSALLQRIRIILIILFNSFTIGVITHMMIGGLDKEGIGIVTEGERTLFIIGMIFPIIVLAIVNFFLYWVKTQPYTITWEEFILFLLAPAVLIAWSIYIQLPSKPVEGINEFLKITGLALLVVTALPTILMFILSLLKNKTYREAKFRAMFVMPGVILSSLSIYMLYLFTKDELVIESSMVPIIISSSFLFGGLLLGVIGTALSAKYVVQTKKNIWAPIRYTSGMPAIIIYSSMIGLSIRLAIKSQIVSMIIIQLVMQTVILGLFGVYLFFFARIRNMHKTNPLQNETVLKLYIATQLLITFIMVYILPRYEEETLKSFTPASFLMAFMGGVIILMGILMANIMNLITYIKYRQATLSSVILTTAIVLGVALAIASLQKSGLITEIIGRQIVIVVTLLPLVFQLLSLAFNLGYIFLNSIVGKRKVKINSKFGEKQINIKQQQQEKGIVAKGSK